MMLRTISIALLLLFAIAASLLLSAALITTSIYLGAQNYIYDSEATCEVYSVTAYEYTTQRDARVYNIIWNVCVHNHTTSWMTMMILENCPDVIKFNYLLRAHPINSTTTCYYASGEKYYAEWQRDIDPEPYRTPMIALWSAFGAALVSSIVTYALLLLKK